MFHTLSWKKKINVYSYCTLCTEYDRPAEFYIFTLFKNAKLLEKGRPNHFVLFQTTGQIGKVNFNKQGSSFPQLLYCAE